MPGPRAGTQFARIPAGVNSGEVGCSIDFSRIPVVRATHVGRSPLKSVGTSATWRLGTTKGAKGAKMEFDDLSNRVIDCAIEVHRHLGPGLLESGQKSE